MSKTEADDCKKIEIWWLLRDMKNTSYKTKIISWGPDGQRGKISCSISLFENDSYVNFNYTQTEYSGEKKDFDYKIPLTKTPCHLGGYRYWFTCTLYKNKVYCGRRVGVLYKDGDWFGCRHCYELTYSSRNENRRYKNYPLFQILHLENKLEKLYMSSRNSTYKGVPTKKRQKIEKINQRMYRYYPRIMKGL